MGKPSSQTSTQTTQVPQYIQNAQQNLLSTAQNFAAPFTSNSPTSTVAGFTPDQTQAFDIARGMAANEFTNGSPTVQNQITPYEQASLPVQQAAQYYGAVNSGPAALMPATSAGSAALTDKSLGQVGGDQINALLNPYTSSVVGSTLDQMRRQLGITQAGIAAKDASSAAFGGSRGALQSSEANRAFSDQAAQITAQLMAQGFDRATATALANASNAQQAGEFNAGQTNNMGQFNASLLDKAIAANQSAMNTFAENNANRQQQANAGNAVAENNMRQYNSTALTDLDKYNTGQRQNTDQYNTNLALNTANTQNTLANSEAARQATALQQLLGIGQTEQQTAQGSLNQPVDMLKLLMQATPGQTGSTTTSTTPTQGSVLGSLGGLVGIGSGLFGSSGLFPGALAALSDEREKTDIMKLGVDPQSGLDMYAYRYKGDPKSYPKVVGPMAGEMEQKYPGTVREIGGKKVVTGGALQAMLGMT